MHLEDREQRIRPSRKLRPRMQAMVRSVLPAKRGLEKLKGDDGADV